MKLFKLFVSCSLLFFHLSVFAQEADTRTYDQVKNEFVKKYVFEDDGRTLSFAKKGRDWYVVLKNYMDREKMEQYLFWNSKAHRFEQVSFPANTTGRLSRAYDAGIMEAYYYSFMPYYGYNGYYADNIEFLRRKANKSDDELYCLARAYSEYAGNLLGNQYGTGLDRYSFGKSFYRQNSLSPRELKIFNTYHDSSLQTYKALVTRTPGYNTHIVGSASNKMYNEYLYRYMTLCMYQDDSMALAGLPDDLYNDFTLGYAKNILDACPQHAILFVEGDNDTYPVLYYQQSRHYRKDITIVNTSLLGTDIYPNYLNDTRQVPLSFSFDESTKNQLLYILTDEKSTDILSLPAFMAKVTDLSKAEEGKPPAVNCKEIMINNKYDTIHLPLKRVLYRSDNLILDILNTQLTKRPVSIGVWTEANGLLSLLLPHCTYNSFTYNLQDFGSGRNSEVNLEVLVKRLTDTAYYHMSEQPLRSDAFVADAYKQILTKAISLCLEAKETAKAKELADFYFEYFPFAKFRPGQMDLLFLYYYKDIYNVTTARALLGILAKQVRKEDYINDTQRRNFEEQIWKTLEVMKAER